MIAFYLLVSVMPFVRHPLFSMFLGDLTMMKIAGGVCAAYAAVHVAMRPRAPRFFPTWQARLYVTLALLGMLSYLLSGGWRAGGPPGEGFATSPFMSYASFVVLLFITVALVDSPHRLRWTLLVASGSIAYSSLHMIREWQKYGGMSSGYRPGWVVGDPNYFALSVLLCLPFTIALLRGRPPQWQRYFCLGCIGVSLFAFTLASSRGGLLGLGLGLLLLAWRSRHRMKVLGLACVLLIPLMFIAPSSPVRRLVSPDRLDVQSMEIRTALWRAGARMFASNPILGVGVGNFKAMLPRYAPGEGLGNIAHNTYVGIGAELGLSGLLLYVGMLGAAFWNAEQVRQRARVNGPPLVHHAAEGFQVALVGYVVAVVFVSAEYHRLFWFVIAVSACLPELVRRRRAGSGPWWARRPEPAAQPGEPAVRRVESVNG